MILSSSAIKQFEEDWKRDVYDKEQEVDPGKEQDWYSLVLGYAIGKGFSVHVAGELANYIRYHTDLG